MRKMNISNEKVQKKLEITVYLINDLNFEIEGETVKTLREYDLPRIEKSIERVEKAKNDLYEMTGKYFYELIEKPQALRFKNKMDCTECIIDSARRLVRMFRESQVKDTEIKEPETKISEQVIEKTIEKHVPEFNKFKVKVEKVETDSKIIENSAVYYDDIGICIEELKDGSLYVTTIDEGESLGTYKVSVI